MKRIFVLFSIFFLTLGIVVLTDTIISDQASSIVLPEIDQAVIDQVRARNVSIETSMKDAGSRGSGILINSHLVLTARHNVDIVLEDEWKKGDNFLFVIKDLMMLRVKSVAFYEPTELPDSLHFMKELDLALLQVEQPGFPLADQYENGLPIMDWVEPGTYLFLYSYRVPKILNGVQFKMVFDIEMNEMFGAICYLVDPVIHPGESGIGVYTLQGDLAGIAVGRHIGYYSWIYSWIYDTSYGFIIPSHYLIYFTKQENLKVVIL